MKVLTIQGCKDCPYLFFAQPEEKWMCRHMQNHDKNMIPDPMDWVVCDKGEDIPSTPHPNCRLNDLPTEDEIKEYADLNTITFREHYGCECGANYVLNKIKNGK